MFHVLTLIVLSVLLFGNVACKMGPDYSRPDFSMEETWKITSATAETLANIPWWELLKDDQLQHLIRTALRENQDVRVAEATIREFHAQHTIARFDLAPSLTYDGRGLIFNTVAKAVPLPVTGTVPVLIPDVSNSQTLSAQSGLGMLKWELDLWGRVRRSIEVAEHQLLSRKENQRAVVMTLLSSVAETYFDLRWLDSQVDITTNAIKSYSETVRIAKVRYELGRVSQMDMQQFEAERADAKAQLADLELQLMQKENQLSFLLGRKPVRITRGLALAEQPLPPAVPAGLPSELLQRRPDILRAEQEVAAATSAIGVAQAQRFPSFSLTGALGISSTQLSSIMIGPAFTQAAIAMLTGPLFNATALGFQVEVAKAKMEQALLEYEKSILVALREVEDALIAVQKMAERRTAQEEQIASLQAAFDYANLRYQSGRASYLDILSAQRRSFNAKLAHATTQRNQLVAVVRLYRALGGGWSPDHGKGELPMPPSLRGNG